MEELQGKEEKRQKGKERKGERREEREKVENSGLKERKIQHARKMEDCHFVTGHIIFAQLLTWTKQQGKSS